MSKPTKTIRLGGIDRPVRFSIATLTKIEDGDQDKRSFDEIASSGRLTDMVTLVFHGLKAGAKKEKEQFPYNRDDVLEWLDEMNLNVFAEQLGEIIEGDMPAESKTETQLPDSPEDPR